MPLPHAAARRLRDNLAHVQQQIAAAAARAGRSRDEVRLIAVTKYVSCDVIAELLAAGLRDLGESRVTQLVQRAAVFEAPPSPLDEEPQAARWHMIGHLQRNKVKPLLARCRIVHSVDSLRLAQEIDARATAAFPIDVLIEVSVAGETAKQGVTPEELPALADEIAAFRRLRLRGLMTMAPLHPDPQRARPHFARLRTLLQDLHARRRVTAACRHLSMGMSQDFTVAIEEGATLVRVGSVLFEGVADEALRSTSGAAPETPEV
ncbi:MAG: Pyridoxal phosphate homeostasis protein [Phycisphaerae bacterium]|nr:Pyridoxal phosphate homeostasis protein [Phycisphaerae bacterium]